MVCNVPLGNYGRDYLSKMLSRIEDRQPDPQVLVLFICVLSPNGRGHRGLSRFF